MSGKNKGTPKRDRDRESAVTPGSSNTRAHSPKVVANSRATPTNSSRDRGTPTNSARDRGTPLQDRVPAVTSRPNSRGPVGAGFHHGDAVGGPGVRRLSKTNDLNDLDDRSLLQTRDELVDNSDLVSLADKSVAEKLKNDPGLSDMLRQQQRKAVTATGPSTLLNLGQPPLRVLGATHGSVLDGVSGGFDEQELTSLDDNQEISFNDFYAATQNRTSRPSSKSNSRSGSANPFYLSASGASGVGPSATTGSSMHALRDQMPAALQQCSTPPQTQTFGRQSQPQAPGSVDSRHAASPAPTTQVQHVPAPAPHFHHHAYPSPPSATAVAPAGLDTLLSGGSNCSDEELIRGVRLLLAGRPNLRPEQIFAALSAAHSTPPQPQPQEEQPQPQPQEEQPPPQPRESSRTHKARSKSSGSELSWDRFADGSIPVGIDTHGANQRHFTKHQSFTHGTAPMNNSNGSSIQNTPRTPAAAAGVGAPAPLGNSLDSSAMFAYMNHSHGHGHNVGGSAKSPSSKRAQVLNIAITARQYSMSTEDLAALNHNHQHLHTASNHSSSTARAAEDMEEIDAEVSSLLDTMNEKRSHSTTPTATATAGPLPSNRGAHRSHHYGPTTTPPTISHGSGLSMPSSAATDTGGVDTVGPDLDSEAIASVANLAANAHSMPVSAASSLQAAAAAVGGVNASGTAAHSHSSAFDRTSANLDTMFRSKQSHATPDYYAGGLSPSAIATISASQTTPSPPKPQAVPHGHGRGYELFAAVPPPAVGPENDEVALLTTGVRCSSKDSVEVAAAALGGNVVAFDSPPLHLATVHESISSQQQPQQSAGTGGTRGGGHSIPVGRYSISGETSRSSSFSSVMSGLSAQQQQQNGGYGYVQQPSRRPHHDHHLDLIKNAGTLDNLIQTNRNLMSPTSAFDDLSASSQSQRSLTKVKRRVRSSHAVASHTSSTFSSRARDAAASGRL